MSKGVRSRFYADIMSFHQEVTGSCNLVVVKYPNGETSKFMVDCGLFQEDGYYDNNKKMICRPENLDFVLITHNHIDHTGRLPFLVKKGYSGLIYMTSTTKSLIGLALTDSCHVLEDLACRKNEKPLYTPVDVAHTLEKIVPCNYQEKIRITSNITATFFKNGHLLGAAMILVTISYEGCSDINILFTGDYNQKNMFFEVEELPEEVKNLPLTVVQESTYGYTDSTKIESTFENNVSRAVNEGKTIIVPVFSLGRAQEILYVVKKMQEKEKIPLSVPIYLDGKLAVHYTELYLTKKFGIKEEMRDFLPDNFQYADKTMRPTLLTDSNCKIILTTSGMGSYGPAQMYIPAYLPNKKALIHFTGYTAEGTLGRKLKDTAPGDTIQVFGLMLVKKAEVEYTAEYSAHAKADEMIEFLKQFTNLRMVLVNHGQSAVKETFANRIMNEVAPRNVGILGNGYLFRVDTYGLIKTMGTKFE